MCTLHTRCQHGVRLRGIAADDDDQIGLFDVGDGTGVAAVTHRAPEALVAGDWQ